MMERYADTPTAEMAAHLGRSQRTIFMKACKMGLKKSEARMEQVRADFARCDHRYRFQPGQKRWWESKYVRPESNKSWFTPGYTPTHKRKIGDVVVRKRKRKWGESVKMVKLTETRWVPLPLYVWLQHGNPDIDSRHVVIQVSGDRDDPQIGDVMMIKKSIAMRMQCHGYTLEEAQCLDLMQQIKQEIKNEDTDE